MVKKQVQAKPLSKAQAIDELCNRIGWSKKDVLAFLGVHASFMQEQLRCVDEDGKPIPYTIPFMGVKVQVVIRPATAKRMGRNPATGEPVEIAAKPKRRVIKARVMKALVDSVLS